MNSKHRLYTCWLLHLTTTGAERLHYKRLVMTLAYSARQPLRLEFQS